MYDVCASYKSATIKMSVIELKRIPWFINLPSSFSISNYAYEFQFLKNDEEVLVLRTFVAIRASWTEYPEKRKVEGNVSLFLKKELENHFEPDEVDFVVKSAVSYGLSFQSVDSIRSGNITPVPYVVKTGEVYSAYVFGRKIAEIKYELEGNLIKVYIDNKLIDEITVGPSPSSKIPQIKNFIAVYLSEDAEIDDRFFVMLSKKYVVLKKRKEILNVKNSLLQGKLSHCPRE